MKRILMMTTALIFGGHMALAAIDAQALADSYIAEGYSYVEVKQGPTHTKVEAVMDGTTVEVIYRNDTGAIVSRETGPTDPEYVGRTGAEVSTTADDPRNGDGQDEADDDGDHGSDHDGNDDHGGNDDGDDHGGNDDGGDDD